MLPERVTLGLEDFPAKHLKSGWSLIVVVLPFCLQPTDSVQVGAVGQSQSIFLYAEGSQFKNL